MNKDTDQNWHASPPARIGGERSFALSDWLPGFRSTAPVLGCYNTGVPSTELLV